MPGTRACARACAYVLTRMYSRARVCVRARTCVCVCARVHVCAWCSRTRTRVRACARVCTRARARSRVTPLALRFVVFPSGLVTGALSCLAPTPAHGTPRRGPGDCAHSAAGFGVRGSGRRAGDCGQREDGGPGSRGKPRQPWNWKPVRGRGKKALEDRARGRASSGREGTARVPQWGREKRLGRELHGPRVRALTGPVALRPPERCRQEPGVAGFRAPSPRPQRTVAGPSSRRARRPRPPSVRVSRLWSHRLLPGPSQVFPAGRRAGSRGCAVSAKRAGDIPVLPPRLRP